MLRNVRITLVALCLALVLIFLLQNLSTIEVHFLSWSVRASSGVLALGCFAIGAFVGASVTMLRPGKSSGADLDNTPQGSD